MKILGIKASQATINMQKCFKNAFDDDIMKKRNKKGRFL
jgi:hypothetical protein